jgi:hypothetical protein
MYDFSKSFREVNLAQNSAEEQKEVKKLAPITIILITILFHYSLYRTLSLLTYTQSPTVPIHFILPPK